MGIRAELLRWRYAKWIMTSTARDDIMASTGFITLCVQVRVSLVSWPKSINITTSPARAHNQQPSALFWVEFVEICFFSYIFRYFTTSMTFYWISNYLIILFFISTLCLSAANAYERPSSLPCSSIWFRNYDGCSKRNVYTLVMDGLSNKRYFQGFHIDFLINRNAARAGCHNDKSECFYHHWSLWLARCSQRMIWFDFPTSVVLSINH